MESFQLEFSRDDEDTRKALQTLDSDVVNFVEPNYFTGDPQVTIAMIGLAAHTVTVIGRVVISCVDRGKHVVLKYGDREFRGSEAVREGLEFIKALEKTREAR